MGTLGRVDDANRFADGSFIVLMEWNSFVIIEFTINFKYNVNWGETMPVYRKLVRDRIPEIIAASGKEAIWRVMEDDEYQKEVRKSFMKNWRSMKQRRMIHPLWKSWLICWN